MIWWTQKGMYMYLFFPSIVYSVCLCRNIPKTMRLNRLILAVSHSCDQV